MIKLLRTTSENKDFIKLVELLDADLAIRDGEEHSFYNQFNKIDAIKHVVVAFKNEEPVGCGAIKQYDNITMEIKRMFVLPKNRGKGIAGILIAELEHWTKALNFTTCILETGLKQPEAISAYKKNGYQLIPNYGQYAGIKNSLCFQKKV